MLSIAKEIFTDSQHKFSSVTAPTGTGKTIGFLEYIYGFENRGPTQFILPTNASLSMIKDYCDSKNWTSDRVQLLTPSAMILSILRNDRKNGIVVIDECHFDSDEYAFLFLYLKHFHQNYNKIILLSATCPISKIKQYFPNCHSYSLSSQEQYHIQTFFTETDVLQYYTSPMSQQHILRNMFQRHMNKNKSYRVLVFCWNSAQCEILAECFENEFENVMSFFGKQSDDQKKKVMDSFYDKNKNFVVFCTNALETSVTICDVNYVFDFGKRYALRNKVLSVEWCDKSALIQRAGRTGRTCDGIVVRMMSESFYEALPEVVQADHSYDAILLNFYKKQLQETAHKVFQDNPRICSDFEEQLRLFHVKCSNNVKFDFIFRYRNEMKMEHAVMLYKLYRRRFEFTYNTLFFLYLSVALIVSMSMSNFPLFYIPKDMRKRKSAFFNKIRKHFDKEQHHDELRTYLNICLNAMIQGKPFIQLYNLNNKFIKDVKKRFLRYWNDAVTFHEIRNLNEFFTSQLNITDRNDCLSFIYQQEFEDVQRFLFYHSQFPRTMSPRSVEYGHSNAIHETVPIISWNNLLSFSPNNFVIKLQTISIANDYGVDNRLVLWTTLSLPSVAEREINIIKENFEHRQEKFAWRLEFRDCISEIDNEVAYRPGKYKMEQAMHDFYSRLHTQNNA